MSTDNSKFVSCCGFGMPVSTWSRMLWRRSVVLHVYQTSRSVHA